jgi:hypothetical protein
LWLAKTSQQPIIQTTWLKVTPHVTKLHCHAKSLKQDYKNKTKNTP